MAGAKANTRGPQSHPCMYTAGAKAKAKAKANAKASWGCTRARTHTHTNTRTHTQMSAASAPSTPGIAPAPEVMWLSMPARTHPGPHPLSSTCTQTHHQPSTAHTALPTPARHTPAALAIHRWRSTHLHAVRHHQRSHALSAHSRLHARSVQKGHALDARHDQHAVGAEVGEHVRDDHLCAQARASACSKQCVLCPGAGVPPHMRPPCMHVFCTDALSTIWVCSHAHLCSTHTTTQRTRGAQGTALFRMQHGQAQYMIVSHRTLSRINHTTINRIIENQLQNQAAGLPCFLSLHVRDPRSTCFVLWPV